MRKQLPLQPIPAFKRDRVNGKRDPNQTLHDQFMSNPASVGGVRADALQVQRTAGSMRSDQQESFLPDIDMKSTPHPPPFPVPAKRGEEEVSTQRPSNLLFVDQAQPEVPDQHGRA